MTDDTTAAALAATEVRCPLCGDLVPAGVYCGACGSHLRQIAHAPQRSYRSHAYAAAPGEHVLRLSVVSSLFPHLPHRSRAPFRLTVGLLGAVLLVLAVLRLQAPLIAVSAVGVPLLFVLYLQECDVYEDLPASLLLVAGALGAALGWSWAALTAHHVTRTVTDSMITGATASRLLADGLLIPLGGAVLLLVPVIVLRLTRPTHLGESLDGYLFGSVSALGFTCASTLTRLEPQLRTGLLDHSRPLNGLVEEGLLQGVAVPLTAAGTIGVFGATIWVRRRSRLHRGRWLASPVSAAVAVLVLYAGLGLLDQWQPSGTVVVAVHLVGAGIALLALRVGIQAVLLHEQHEVRAGPMGVCPHCEQPVPQMPFCPHCGSAGRASSRHSRRLLRLEPITAEEPASND